MGKIWDQLKLIAMLGLEALELEVRVELEQYKKKLREIRPPSEQYLPQVHRDARVDFILGTNDVVPNLKLDKALGWVRGEEE